LASGQWVRMPILRNLFQPADISEVGRIRAIKDLKHNHK
jgi:hypothetical protein